VLAEVLGNAGKVEVWAGTCPCPYLVQRQSTGLTRIIEAVERGLVEEGRPLLTER
jgi:hypothetical protein